MHPEMKKKIDDIVVELTQTHNVPRKLVEVQINHCLIRAKLDVLGANVKDRKIDVKDSCEKLANEVSLLAYQASELAWAGGLEKLPFPERAEQEKLMHSKIATLATEVVTKLNPVIQQYFMGIEPGRKPS